MAAKRKVPAKRKATAKPRKQDASAKPEQERKKRGAPPGNQFWKARSTHGRNPIFKSPDELWDACLEYFDWVEANPLWETVIKTAHGEPVPVTVPKMRAMTISGLCIFLDISETCWSDYRKRKDFSGVATRVERIIYNQKFAGASADLLNANIIARDLGLKDGQEVSGPGGGPVEHTHKIERRIVRPDDSDS